MAAYNGAALIGETIASLQAQTFRDFDVVIVDDCSTDDTRSMLAAIDDPRFRVIHAPENGGPVRARNRAFAEARGRYIAGLDQDDLCLPDRLARQVAYLDANHDTVLVGTAASVFDGVSARPSSLPAATTPALIEWLLQIMNPLVWSSVMLRADAAQQLVPFTRPDRLYAEDFDLYHRLARLGSVARIDDELLLYRSHGGGASQRFVTTMYASATQILADRHAAILGDDASERCALLVRHVMGQLPVPDRATLARLGDTIMRLQHAFFAERPLSRDDRKLIRWETARLWGRIGRASIRSGKIGVVDAVAVRPDHLGLGYLGLDTLALSQAIGSARHWTRKRA
jgi:hypothetical protein